MTAPDLFVGVDHGPGWRRRSVRAALARIRLAADAPAMRTRAATLVVLLLIALMTSGCQVIAMAPWYIGIEQSGIASPPTVAGLCLELRVAPQDGQAIDASTMDQVLAVVAARVGMIGIADPSVERTGDHIVVWLPGLADGADVLDALSGLLTAPGVVVFLPVPEARLGTLVDGQPVPDDMAALPPIVDGEGIAAASVRLDEQTGGPLLALELTTAAAADFDEYAAAHVGGQVAIVVDGTVVVAPALRATEFGGQIEVSLPTTQAADRDALDQLAAVLRSGPLPLPLEEVSAGPCG
jgi:preprotein translocase subunit SecD